MSNYNTKNYTEPGGERTVIGGELSFVPGSRIARKGTDHALLRYLPDSTATTVAGVKADFNALLASLRAVGILEAEVPEITIVAQPEAELNEAETHATMAVDAVASDGDVLAYQWQKDGVNIDGATSASVTVEMPAEGTENDITCIITIPRSGVTVTTETVTLGQAAGG